MRVDTREWITRKNAPWSSPCNDRKIHRINVLVENGLIIKVF